MDKKYIIPAQTRIGHVHLKVSNLQRSLVSRPCWSPDQQALEMYAEKKI